MFLGVYSDHGWDIHTHSSRILEERFVVCSRFGTAYPTTLLNDYSVSQLSTGYP